MFTRVSIAARLMGAFGVMCVIILMLVGFGLLEQRVADDTMTTLKRQSGNAMQIERSARLFAQARLKVNAALAGGDEAAWAQTFAALAQAREQQVKVTGSIVNPQRRAKAEALLGLIDQYQGVLGKLRAGDATAEAKASVQSLAERIDGEADALIVAIRDASAKATELSEAEMARMTHWGMAVAAAGIVLAVALTIAISRGLAQPLARMSAAMGAIAGGDAAVRVPCVERADAIGHMARALEVFRRNAEENQRLQAEQEAQRQAAEIAKRNALCGMAATVESEAESAVADIARLTADMTAAVDRLHGVAVRTSQGANDSAETAERVLSTSDAVAAATQQLQGSIDDIGQHLHHTRAVARQAVVAAGSAEEVMAGLSDTTHRIGQVVDMISTLAGKTNMLALNATIEAARAGEAGKGFAVVAGEVKTLANQTEHATGEITTQIAAIVEVAERAMGAIRAVSGTIADMESGAGAIAAAVEQQAAATQEITCAVNHTFDASRQVAALMARMADEARQSSDLSTDVKKDGARVTETLAGFSHTLGRVIRTSTPEVDRRRDTRYGVFVPCRVTADGAVTEATLTNVSAGGVALQVAGECAAVGQVLELECGALGGVRAVKVIATQRGLLHTVFDGGDRLAEAVMERVGHDGALALLEKAKSDHETFVAGVLAVLGGTSAAKAADLANHHTCRLGKWYDNVSDQRFLDCPAFAQMVEPHRRVHQIGKQVLSAHWQGDAAAAAAAAQDLRRASAEVIGLLDRLAAEVRQGRAAA